MTRVLRLWTIPLLLVIPACTTTAQRQAVPTRAPEAPQAAEAPAAEAPPTPTPALPDGVTFAAVGDIGQGNAVQRQVGERIAALHAEHGIDVVLLLGDLVYPDGAGERWEANFAEPWRAVLDAGIPLRAALGNHDVQTRDGADMMERFRMPGRYYAFEGGPVAFFAVDSNRLDEEQLGWLDAQLAATEAPWRVLFMHHPPYSSSPHHGSNLGVRRALEPLVERHGVQLVLAGHDHNYERTHPIGGTAYVVAGTGCCLRSFGRSDLTAFAENEPGVALFGADQTHLVARFVAADGRVLDATVYERAGAAVAPSG